jgi:diguanylate cyclase (GGDEF)-like protein
MDEQQYHCLPPGKLSRFLERYKAALTLHEEFELNLLLKEILRKANEFVPAEAGSILLDDPQRKRRDRERNELQFIATFGRGSDALLGRPLPATDGIAGKVYQTGEPYLSEDVWSDEYFFSEIDQELEARAKSIICVPIYIGKTVCGVLELINRKDGERFTERDKLLLEIFAGYTSFTFQSALDARRAHELAKRDDLTGLYNDRWLHHSLAETLRQAIGSGQTTGLLFLDLDNFKYVNDAHGHLAGSQVLREVGFLLTQTVDPLRATISRYGGDEFVLILPDTDREEARRIAEQVSHAIGSHIYIQEDLGPEVPAIRLEGVISVSIGLALQESPPAEAGVGEAKNELLRKADKAMYAAKAAGKGKIFVHDAGESCVAV